MAQVAPNTFPRTVCAFSGQVAPLINFRVATGAGTLRRLTSASGSAIFSGLEQPDGLPHGGQVARPVGDGGAVALGFNGRPGSGQFSERRAHPQQRSRWLATR
jgi:hypothetical protein